MVGAALFAAALFAAPASQLQNTFLKHERGFDAAHIALFTLVTSTPGGLGIAFGGRLADTRGRRLIGAIGVLGGSTLALIGFYSHGWQMWAWTLVGPGSELQPLSLSMRERQALVAFLRALSMPLGTIVEPPAYDYGSVAGDRR